MTDKQNWVVLESSAITAISYRSRVKQLYILFRNGAIYCYQEISYDKYRRFLKAESAGKYFNKSIVDKHVGYFVRELGA